MKWLRTIVVFDKGDVIASKDWATVHESYVRAIKAIDHPKGTGKLTIREKAQLPDKQWQRNGVNYLRSFFLDLMVNKERWGSEGSVDLDKARKQAPLRLYPSLQQYNEPITSDFGGFDFATTAPAGAKVAIEWETGNISSSHRSMNKLSIALENGLVEIGVLILPSRALYQHLTDRIGNIGELSGYLAMWESTKANVKRGLLAITVVEHDELTNNKKCPYMKVGNDGRAKQGRAKLRLDK